MSIPVIQVDARIRAWVRSGLRGLGLGVRLRVRFRVEVRVRVKG